MKKIFVFFLCAFLLFIPTLFFCHEKQGAITYHISPIFRFGDGFLIYAKAKWLALKYNLALHYTPFRYSNQLALHRHERHYKPDIERQFKTKKKIGSEHDITQQYHNPTLYISDLFAYLPSVSNYSLANSSSPGDTNINDICEEALTNPTFDAEMKKALQPIIPLPRLHLPKDAITVAIHLRKGGGYDRPLYSEQLYTYSEESINHKNTTGRSNNFIDVIHPFKFPPDQFYIDQLTFLSDLLDDAPLYVFIFTDDQNPTRLCEIFEKECKKSNIIFDCRKSENRHDQNVIEDLWAMAQFDCLIRNWSHFSGVAQLLGRHKIIIYPRRCFWADKKLIMNENFIVLRDITHNKLFTFILSPNNQEKLKQTVRHVLY